MCGQQSAETCVVGPRAGDELAALVRDLVAAAGGYFEAVQLVVEVFGESEGAGDWAYEVVVALSAAAAEGGVG